MRGNPLTSHHPGYLNISANIVGSSLKPGRRLSPHLQDRREKGLSEICPIQEGTTVQDTLKEKILNEVSAHKTLRDLLVESTVNLLHMQSLDQSLNSQGPRNHNPIPRHMKSKVLLSGQRQKTSSRSVGKFP